jgi:hypothetical protein
VLRLQGTGFRTRGVGFTVQFWGFMFRGLRLRVQGLGFNLYGFRVADLRIMIWGLWLREQI